MVPCLPTFPVTLLSMSSPSRGSGVKTADTTMMSHSMSEGMLLRSHASW